MIIFIHMHALLTACLKRFFHQNIFTYYMYVRVAHVYGAKLREVAKRSHGELEYRGTNFGQATEIARRSYTAHAVWFRVGARVLVGNGSSPASLQPQHIYPKNPVFSNRSERCVPQVG